MDFTQIRRLIIVALFSDDALFETLVLKGGNAISLIYGFGNRASLDLDFSMENDFENVGEIRERIFGTLRKKFGDVGLIVFDEDFGPRPQRPRPDAAPLWGGYHLKFKLIEETKHRALGGDLERIRRNAVTFGPNQLRVFTVDLSKHEYCAGKVERELDNYTIFVYTPEMIVLEKLRAICQQMPDYQLNPSKRARARDFYDIHLLVTAEGMSLTTDENITLVQDIFSAKDVPLVLLSGIKDQREMHRIDWAAVKDSVSGPLHEFEFYFEFVLGEATRIIEALRIE